MPAPTNEPGFLRPDLQDAFTQIDLEASRAGFIWPMVFRIFDAQLAADSFGKVTVESLLRNVDTTRAPRAGYGRDDFEWTTDSYATQEHGWEGLIDDNESRKYANWMNYELVVARRTLDAVLRHAERRVATAVFNAAIWTGAALTTGITNEWDDFTNATPIADVEGAKDKVFDGTGLDANALIINKKVFSNLKRCEEIKDILAASGAGQAVKAGAITAQHLSEVFELKHIIVAGGSQNTAIKGQDRSISRIWSNEYAMVCRVAETDDLSEPCIGRTFHWGGDGSQIQCAFEQYYLETNRSQVIRYRNQTDEKRLYTECGHLLSNITT